MAKGFSIFAHFSKVIFVSLLITILAGCWVFYQIGQKKSDAAWIDSTYMSQCKKQMARSSIKPTQIPQMLLKQYGKKMPVTAPTATTVYAPTPVPVTVGKDRRNSVATSNPKPAQKIVKPAEYNVDLDTYAASWDQAPNGKELLASYRQKMPAIIQKMKEVYGQPFQNNKVVVVVVEDFVNSQYNEFGAQEAGGQYRPDLNVIFLDTSIVDLEQYVIHELVHTFNKGTISVDAYEEGMVESTARIVSAALGYPAEAFPLAASTNGRYDLSNVMGYFRTMGYYDQYDLVHERYNTAAAFFYGIYNQDHNIYKDIRAKIQKNRFFVEQIANSVQFNEKMIANSFCADLMFKPNENVLRAYVSDMQNILLKSLPTSIRSTIKSTDMNLHPFRNYADNPIINVFPDNKLYTDIGFDMANDKLRVFSTYKRNSLIEVIFQDYITINGLKNVDDLEVVRDSLVAMSDRFTGSNALTELSSFFEDPADSVKLVFDTSTQSTLGRMKTTLQNSKDLTSSLIQNTKIVDLGKSTGPEATEMNSYQILNYANLPLDFTGNLNMTVKTQKKVWVVTPTNSENFLVTHPHGLRGTARIIADSLSSHLKFVNGKLVSFSNDPPETTLTFKGCVIPNGVTKGGGSILFNGDYPVMQDAGGNGNGKFGESPTCKTLGNTEPQGIVTGNISNCTTGFDVVSAQYWNPQNNLNLQNKKSIGKYMGLQVRSNGLTYLNLARLGLWHINLACKPQ